MICSALEKQIPRFEELADWAQKLSDDDPEKATFLSSTKEQLAAALSAYKKLQ